MCSGAPEHRSDRGENLAEFVVQFARDVAQRGFLRGDELLGQFAAALGDFGQAREQAAVPANQREAVQQDGEQGRGQKDINLALHAVVNLNDALSGLLFVFAVLHQQAGNGRAQCGLAFLQGNLNLLASFFVLSIASESEDAVDGIPELGEGAGQKRALLGSTAGGANPASRRMASSRSVRMRWNCADQAVSG